MGEVRYVSSTGGEKGVKPERLDLIPREGLEAIARVYAFGAEKYADHNWRRGYEWGKSYAALQRHLLAFWAGETFDEESGLPHLAHAGFHVMALLTWLEQDGEGSEFDDRYRPAAEDISTILEGLPMTAKGILSVERTVRDRVGEAEQAPEEVRLRTGYDWQHIFEIEVTDPDGWRKGDGVTFNTPITRADFQARIAVSTYHPRRMPTS